MVWMVTWPGPGTKKTRLGTLLDPLADKILLDSTIIILALGVGDIFRIPVWFVLIVISRDLFLLVISLFLHQRWSRGTIQIRPNWWGKTAAVLLMATVVWILIHPHYPPHLLTWVALYITALFTVVSGGVYLIRTLKELRIPKPH